MYYQLKGILYDLISEMNVGDYIPTEERVVRALRGEPYHRPAGAP